jgi:hypothetical protein
MGLGAEPFRVVDGELRFEPKPVLAEWFFTGKTSGAARDRFGFMLFGRTQVVYHNPKRRDTFGSKAVQPAQFQLTYADGREQQHAGAWLPGAVATDLRDGKLSRLEIALS